MKTTLVSARAERIAPNAMVLLPAALTAPQDFVTLGFGAAIQERGLPVDLAIAQISLEHVTDHTVVERLRQGVIQPARARGYRSIWLCGVSIGAFVALSYVARHQGEIDGLCLLTPYLGSHLVIGEIERAGGLRGWQPGVLAADDDERHVWHFIRSCGAPPIPIHVGLGREDRFVRGQRILAAAVPPDCVDTVPGEHDWSVWRRLWDNFLDGWHPST